ncbi:MAG: hypothetical protein HY748_00770 [Elusimicrobia bacterium]|nr:hypothetical protein [Elusimicrobiota bacterium]
MKLAKVLLVVVCAVAVACVGQLFADQNASGSIEDQQVAAKAKTIVTQAKEMAKTQAEDSKQSGQPKAENADPDRKLAAMAELLKGASAEAKLEFLESLTLVDGKVASVKIDLLKRELGEARVREILVALNPHPQPAYKITPPLHVLALCGDTGGGYCDDSACRNRPSGSGKGCLPEKGHLCFDSCN